MQTALYPGSFDPVTNGHLSLIRRGCQFFDRIIVAVADITPKPPLFSLEERVEMIREAIGTRKNVEVVPFSGLTIEYAAKRNCCALLRGMRAASDFEFEFQLALMNRRLNHAIETVFLMTDYRWLFISSTIIKGAASNGANISGLVPDNVVERLTEKFTSGMGKKGTPCLMPAAGGFAASLAKANAPGLVLPTQLEKEEVVKSRVQHKERVAIYPGTFDPITNGHLSIVRRALRVFDRVIVAVAENVGKHPLFSLEDRVRFVQEATKDQQDRIRVEPYRNLTVDFAVKYGACAILRGLRATGDFEYEFQLALMNRRLRRNVQTVFFMTDYQWLFVSSSIVKAAASNGGSVDGLVPDHVRDALIALYTKGGIRQSTPCMGTPVEGFTIEKEQAPKSDTQQKDDEHA